MLIPLRWENKLWALSIPALQKRAAKGRECGCSRCFACAAEAFRAKLGVFK